MSRGGPRSGAGRPRRADPVTADEAVRELERFGVSAFATPLAVCLDLPAAVYLLNKLRRRKSTTKRTEKP